MEGDCIIYCTKYKQRQFYKMFRYQMVMLWIVGLKERVSRKNIVFEHLIYLNTVLTTVAEPEPVEPKLF